MERGTDGGWVRKGADSKQSNGSGCPKDIKGAGSNECFSNGTAGRSTVTPQSQGFSLSFLVKCSDWWEDTELLTGKGTII